MPAQRCAATRLPVRELGPAGVIRMIRMNSPAQRPTSGASAETLAAQLREVRRRTNRLVDDLAPEQLMGRKLDTVNPILWEIGHIGWFHERWTLRQARGEAPLRADGDALWDSSAVPHATRWTLPLPDREGTAAYLGEVMSRQLDRLGQSNLSDEVRYFYDLCIRHEDMHVEALTYTRQTLGYAPPELGDPAPEGAGALPGDAEVPGGTWRLGSTADEGFIFDNEKWAHGVTLAPFRIALAPVSNLDFAGFVADDGYAHQELWSAGGWAWREAAGAQRPVYWVEENGQYGWRR
jgi:gamma-glutamyl hercynylcysteine S-oxide synthase